MRPVSVTTMNSSMAIGSNLGILLTGSIALGFMLGPTRRSLKKKMFFTINIITIRGSSNLGMMSKRR